MATKVAGSAQEYIRRYEALSTEKQPWMVHFQQLAETFFTRKMDFLRVLVPGQFLQADVFDNTGQFAAYLMASVLVSMLWPDAERAIVIEPARRLKGLPGVEEYFRFVTDEVRAAMDNPRSGWTNALFEYVLEQVVFGTAGLGSFEGPEEDPNLAVTYESWDIKNMVISENAQGFVDLIMYERELRVHQIVKEYQKTGDVISEKIREKFKVGGAALDEKFRILYVIEPKTPDRKKDGVAGMACRTLHLDIAHETIMRESGYHELPVSVGRFFKKTGEPYGRSPAMTGLPDAQSLNVLTEAVLVASEKQLDPPLIVLDDGRLGGGVVDTSSGAINVYDTSGRLGQEKPIAPLYTVGEFKSVTEEKKELRGLIMQAFFLDRLLDLNNNTQMTAYETSVRNKMRGQALGAIFSRQNTETLTPQTERTFNILYRRGQLGVIDKGIGYKVRQLWNKITGAAADVVVPKAVVEAMQAGLDAYQVVYISPAAQFMQAEKLQGLMSAMDAVLAIAPLSPGIMDNINPDELARAIFELNGAPKEPLLTKEDLLKVRAANLQKQMNQEKLAQAQQGADIALKGAQARAQLGTVTPAGAGAPPPSAR